MAEIATVAVEATAERLRALKHFPSGIGFEADGTARWPADAFTFALARDGDIRLLEDLHDPGGSAAAAPVPAADPAPADAPAPEADPAAPDAAHHQE